MVDPLNEPDHEPDEAEIHEFVVPQLAQGQRLDLFLVDKFPDLSRSRIGNLIRDGFVRLNTVSAKAAVRLKSNDHIEIAIPEPEPLDIKPEKVEFQVLHEDEDILVIVKPPGVVVHPASGHRKGTLVHGLLAHCRDLSGISGVERPGIVHRLDKDTSGVMVIAKNDKSHHALVELFKDRQVKKVYHALIKGKPADSEGIIAQPIGRHRSNRKKMAVLTHGGREAVTRWRVLEDLPGNYTYVEARPETGRTHQIRVHMAFTGHPVAGDTLYGGKQHKDPVEIKRQCLHAYSIGFSHPVTKKPVEFVAPVWPDMQEILEKLRGVDHS